MNVLNHLAQAAAVILLIELLVILLLLLGIAGGLAFGLRWVNGKTDPAFDKANGWLELVPRYTERASDIATSPLVKATGVMRNVQVTAHALRESVRQRQHATAAPVRAEAARVDIDATMEVGARPVPHPGAATESIEPASLV